MGTCPLFKSLKKKKTFIRYLNKSGYGSQLGMLDFQEKNCRVSCFFLGCFTPLALIFLYCCSGPFALLFSAFVLLFSFSWLLFDFLLHCSLGPLVLLFNFFYNSLMLLLVFFNILLVLLFTFFFACSFVVT